MSDLEELQRFVDQAPRQVLVLHDPGSADLARSLTAGDVVLRELGQEVPDPQRRWTTLAVLVTDVAVLRRAATLFPQGVRTRNLAVWVTEADRALAIVPRPEWPVAEDAHARLLPSQASLSLLRLARLWPAHQMVAEYARSAVASRHSGSAGLHVATTVPSLDAVPPAYPGLPLLADAAAASDTELVIPPDVVIGEHTGILPSQHVIERAPALVGSRERLTGPLDEAVLNPRGYVRAVERGVAELDRAGRVRADGELVTTIDPDRGVTTRNVAALRPFLGVHVDLRRQVGLRWRDAAPAASLLAGLAMSGVPVQTRSVPRSVGYLLGPRLTAALEESADLADPLQRDEHSVRLRRAALLEHSTLAWRARQTSAAGLASRAFPSVSIVLPTKRPHLLEFALRQVAKQHTPAELVVAAHGHTADPALVREILGDRPFTLLSLPESALFGDVLDAGVRAASGDLIVKMDDDDWYGPDFLTDLLLARHYAGSQLTGMTPEFVYLQQLDRTLRRKDEGERNVQFVAGGTMMIDRAFLADVGGFRPVRRFVDAQLLAAVHSAGGTVYRTHGLGYMVRRTGEGHTWEPGIDFFLDGERIGWNWPGFRPSRLLEHAEHDRPVKVADEARA